MGGRGFLLLLGNKLNLFLNYGRGRQYGGSGRQYRGAKLGLFGVLLYFVHLFFVVFSKFLHFFDDCGQLFLINASF